MARRYRYIIKPKKEAQSGKWSVACFVLSVLAFLAALLASLAGPGGYLAYLPGGLCLFGALVGIYGFLLGIFSFSEKDKAHRTSIVGSMANGILFVAWLGLYLAS